MRSVSWLRWLFLTKDGEIVVAQAPNLPLILAFVADVVSYLAKGQVQSVSDWIAKGLFGLWAVMEIGWGVNPFRRLLGVGVLALVGWSSYGKLA